MFEQFPSTIAGLPIWVISLVALWELLWNGIAMWVAARRKQLVLFVIFLVVNLLGIPEIIYLCYVTSKNNEKKEKVARNKKRR